MAREDGTDERHLRVALSLASRAEGRTHPNPLVGAVVVQGDEIVGRGYHRRAGQPHAEVEALRDAGKRARGATLVLNLEPCSHTGKTPPCTDAIIQAQIRRVVAGMQDPNPRVDGRGMEALRAAGLEVRTGVLEEECRRLNEDYVTFITTGRPFVILKLAASLDGRIAPGDRNARWITGEAARRHVHRVRARVGGVIVGAGTMAQDDPRLTVRDVGTKHRGRNPTRIVVDSRLRTPFKAKAFGADVPGDVILATTRAAPAARAKRLEALGVEVLTLPSRRRRVGLTPLLDRLGQRGIVSVLVEGGSELAASFVREGLVDKFLIFYAPILLGDEGVPMLGKLGIRSMGRAIRLERAHVHRYDADTLVEAYPAPREGAEGTAERG